jgi:hypothetical protein
LWLKITKILEQEEQKYGKKFKNSETKVIKIWESKFQKYENFFFKNQGTEV